MYRFVITKTSTPKKFYNNSRFAEVFKQIQEKLNSIIDRDDKIEYILLPKIGRSPTEYTQFDNGCVATHEIDILVRLIDGIYQPVVFDTASAKKLGEGEKIIKFKFRLNVVNASSPAAPAPVAQQTTGLFRRFLNMFRRGSGRQTSKKGSNGGKRTLKRNRKR